MSKTPDILWRLPSQLWYFLGVPLFFLAFSLFYKPFDVELWLDMGRGLTAFNTTILMTIILLCMVITRLSIFFLRHALGHSWLNYAGICLAEMLVCSAFMALFVELMQPGGYFSTFGRCTKQYFFSAIIPYAIITLSLVITAKDEEEPEADDNTLVRFHDSNKSLKFIVAEKAILYIKAEENYLRIYYLDGDRIKDYHLRSSMTAVESTAAKGRLFRCHRSYYINPSHIKTLRKDSMGAVTAELDTGGIGIPVSRKMYQALSELI